MIVIRQKLERHTDSGTKLKGKPHAFETANPGGKVKEGRLSPRDSVTRKRGGLHTSVFCQLRGRKDETTCTKREVPTWVLVTYIDSSMLP